MKKLDTLFELLPFDEEAIEIFKDNFRPGISEQQRGIEKSTAGMINLSKNPNLFWQPNDKGQPFIEVLLELEEPKTIEENKIRLFLMEQFLLNQRLDSTSTDGNFEIISQNAIKIIENKYNNMYSNAGITPKFTLDGYCNQIIQVIDSSTNKNEIKEKVSLILDDYFKDMETIAYHSKEESFVALAMKAKNSKIFDYKLTAVDFAQLYSSKSNIWTEELREFFIDVFANNYRTTGRTINLEDKYMTLKEELMYEVFTKSISDLLITNKILTNYETLSAELGSNEEVKSKKPKL